MAAKPDFGFFRADAVNAFNFVSQVIMIGNVHHEWAIAFHFVFNCYHHCGLLVVHSSSGTRCFLCSEEGVTQGDPLAMILCGLSVLPLIYDLKSQFKILLHVWFADDGNAGGKLQDLKQFFCLSKNKGENLWMSLGPLKMRPHHNRRQFGLNPGPFL